jgi:putative FmdB family regulatory protein
VPIYEYECGKCGVFEQSQRISEPALTKCPTCRRKVRRLISSTSFQLKGSGWYVTDYARAGQNGKDGNDGKDGKDGSKDGESKSESASGGASDAKADTKSESTSDTKSSSKSNTKSTTAETKKKAGPKTPATTAS